MAALARSARGCLARRAVLLGGCNVPAGAPGMARSFCARGFRRSFRQDAYYQVQMGVSTGQRRVQELHVRSFGSRSIDASMTLVGMTPPESFESDNDSSSNSEGTWVHADSDSAGKLGFVAHVDSEQVANQSVVSWVNQLDLDSTIGMTDPHIPQYQSQDAIDLQSLIRNRHSNILPKGELARITTSELKEAMESKNPKEALQVFFSTAKVDTVLQYVESPVIEEVEETPDFPVNKAQGNTRMLS